MRTVRRKSKERSHVALLVETSHASGRDILCGITRFLREHDPWSLFIEPHGLEESFPHWLRRWRGDGIIARIQHRQHAEAVRAIGIPTVDVLGLIPEAQFPLVHVDDDAIARMAARHLEERGFRHFAFVGIGGLNWSMGRRDAFVESARRAGGDSQVYELPRRDESEASWEIIEDDLAKWVRRLPKPCGAMICSDQIGPKFLEACRRARVSVPDELAVIGVDNDGPLCEVCNPPLSSVRPNHEAVGYAAARLLDRLMRGHAPPAQPVWIQPQGIQPRLSTQVLAVDDRHLANALQLIREHACAGLRVDELARRVGLSRSVLQRRFRALLRRTIHDEIQNVRLQHACNLLAETDLPLVDIAEKSGFRHQEYMGVIFKKHLHFTPAKYRRNASQTRF
jgi:LacI family transcriptional regulator